MTNSYKLALLAALGLASISAQAQTYSPGDLILGIYDPAAANTLVVDLGSANSITGQTYEQWNLSTYLTAANITTTANTQYGVIGGTAGSPNTVWATGLGSTTFSSLSVAGGGSVATTLANGLANYYKVTAVGSSWATSSDWFNGTISNPPQSGAFNAYLGNPNSTIGTSEILYKSTNPYTTGRPAVQQPGTETTYLDFNLGANDVLTYGTAAVPEPSTYGLIAGVGLLALSLRNKLVRKQA